jgi:hypothetical protein
VDQSLTVAVGSARQLRISVGKPVTVALVPSLGAVAEQGEIKMFHKSELGHFGERFPHDLTGYVPTAGDCWRQMRFDHADMDPDEAGISAEERTHRVQHLDVVWWPRVLQQVHGERQRLEAEHGESFIEHWERVVNHATDVPHGFEVE